MGFILPLSSTYRLTSDANSVMLQQRYKSRGRDAWRPVLYYTSIEGAIEGYCERVQRTSDIEGWLALKEVTDCLYAEITRLASSLSVDVRGALTATVKDKVKRA